MKFTELAVVCFLTTVCLLAPALVDTSTGANAWVYNAKEPGLDPSHWSQGYHVCGEHGQSPIDIEVSKAVANSSLKGLTLSDWDKKPESLSITNNGHSATVTVTGDFRVSGAALPGTFRVAQFHFHWGSKNTQGSEHKLNGIQFPIEMHTVLWNTAYDNFTAASTEYDGLAVIGVMFKIGRYGEKKGDHGPNHKAAFHTIQKQLGNIVDYGTSTSVPVQFTMRDIFPNDLYPLYRYHGSLTTPGCYESVTWTVLGQTDTVPGSFVRALRRLKDSEGLALINNFRPVQFLNNRTVTTCCG